MQSDYKQGKCYLYFTCEFVREVLYHPTTAASKLCFLKCKVVPSHRVKSKPYDVWAFIEKDNEIPGGNVKSAYCSCVAGLVGTSNHVVAMFFHIEYTVTFSLPKPTSISKLCTWNVPSGSKVDMVPKRIKDICFDKAQYMKEENSKK